MLDEDWEEKNPYLSKYSASTDLRTQRIQICKSCEELSQLKFCKKCNCFMPVKTWLKTKKCPLSKW